MRALRRSGVDRAFDRLLAEAGPALASRVRESTPVDRMHGWGGVPGFARRSHGAGWALVGDAGYFKDPITTHGITNALRDAELLADAVLESRADGTPEGRALATYQATRDRLSHRLFVATDAVASYDWDTPTVQRRLREVSSAMSDEVDHLTDRTHASTLAGPLRGR
jgi:flavin-dependent dehydrogenase